MMGVRDCRVVMGMLCGRSYSNPENPARRPIQKAVGVGDKHGSLRPKTQNALHSTSSTCSNSRRHKPPRSCALDPDRCLWVRRPTRSRRALLGPLTRTCTFFGPDEDGCSNAGPA
ncbi:unnamed protein product [Ectocarpus sp. CCAP 1310/34]|nr:unnamed protein product [Ectocarpus sp. CCAP 1310/34]